jgi:hypothetical protein
LEIDGCFVISRNVGTLFFSSIFRLILFFLLTIMLVLFILLFPTYNGLFLYLFEIGFLTSVVGQFFNLGFISFYYYYYFLQNLIQALVWS